MDPFCRGRLLDVPLVSISSRQRGVEGAAPYIIVNESVYSTPLKYRPLVQAPGSKPVGLTNSARTRSTSLGFSVVK